jgi:hypothetical protein
LLDVLQKRIDHSAVVIAFVGPKEPAANECVDLAAVNFYSNTPKAGPPACSAAPHSLS